MWSVPFSCLRKEQHSCMEGKNLYATCSDAPWLPKVLNCREPVRQTYSSYQCCHHHHTCIVMVAFEATGRSLLSAASLEHPLLSVQSVQANNCSEEGLYKLLDLCDSKSRCTAHEVADVVALGDIVQHQVAGVSRGELFTGVCITRFFQWRASFNSRVAPFSVL